MKTLIIGDLHLDRWLNEYRDPLENLTPEEWSEIGMLIVAGDLSNNPKIRWAECIRYLASYIDPSRIYIVPGNHDYYHHVLHGNILAEIAETEGAHLSQKEVILSGNTRFLCCTLWTDFNLYGSRDYNEQVAYARMNDYLYTRRSLDDARHMTPADTRAVHEDHLAWLAHELSQPFPGRTIVVTHHCPHPLIVYASKTDVAPAYASDLLNFIEMHQPDSWYYGHTHYCSEAFVGKTFVCNISFGYPFEIRQPKEQGRRLRRGMIET